MSAGCCGISVVDPVLFVVAACLLLIRFYSLLRRVCWLLPHVDLFCRGLREIFTIQKCLDSYGWTKGFGAELNFSRPNQEA
jgi:hypothetical protein